MDIKIIELISLLSIDEDFDLIQALYSKLSQILTEKEQSKNFEYKYSAEKIKKSNEWGHLKHGIQILYLNQFLYNDEKYIKYKKKDNWIKRNEMEQNAKFKANDFAENLPDDIIIAKYILNKINRKLLKLKS
jgi:hypothetical protein